MTVSNANSWSVDDCKELQQRATVLARSLSYKHHDLDVEDIAGETVLQFIKQYPTPDKVRARWAFAPLRSIAQSVVAAATEHRIREREIATELKAISQVEEELAGAWDIEEPVPGSEPSLDAPITDTDLIDACNIEAGQNAEARFRTMVGRKISDDERVRLRRLAVIAQRQERWSESQRLLAAICEDVQKHARLIGRHACIDESDLDRDFAVYLQSAWFGIRRLLQSLEKRGVMRIPNDLNGFLECDLSLDGPRFPSATLDVFTWFLGEMLVLDEPLGRPFTAPEVAALAVLGGLGTKLRKPPSRPRNAVLNKLAANVRDAQKRFPQTEVGLATVSALPTQARSPANSTQVCSDGPAPIPPPDHTFDRT